MDRDLTKGIPRDCIVYDGSECTAPAPEKRCSRCRTVYYCSLSPANSPIGASIVRIVSPSNRCIEQSRKPLPHRWMDHSWRSIPNLWTRRRIVLFVWNILWMTLSRCRNVNIRFVRNASLSGNASARNSSFLLLLLIHHRRRHRAPCAVAITKMWKHRCGTVPPCWRDKPTCAPCLTRPRDNNCGKKHCSV